MSRNKYIQNICRKLNVKIRKKNSQKGFLKAPVKEEDIKTGVEGINIDNQELIKLMDGTKEEMDKLGKTLKNRLMITTALLQ